MELAHSAMNVFPICWSCDTEFAFLLQIYECFFYSQHHVRIHQDPSQHFLQMERKNNVEISTTSLHSMILLLALYLCICEWMCVLCEFAQKNDMYLWKYVTRINWMYYLTCFATITHTRYKHYNQYRLIFTQTDTHT